MSVLRAMCIYFACVLLAYPDVWIGLVAGFCFSIVVSLMMFEIKEHIRQPKEIP